MTTDDSIISVVQSESMLKNHAWLPHGLVESTGMMRVSSKIEIGMGWIV
jgi:hypothetical protein